ncbi:MAG: hypothetical protein R3A49_04335 [Acidimicrobiia bacterium]
MSTVGGSAARNGGAYLIPLRRRVTGPVVTSRLRRTMLGFAVVWALAALPLLLDARPGWKAFGLGLFVPGGGFLYTSDILLLVVTLVVFALACFAWFGSGMIVAPPAVWVGAAGLAVARVHSGLWDWAEWLVPTLTLAGVAVGLLVRRSAFRSAARRAEERNRYLADLVTRPASAPPERIPESSAEDLRAARFLLDRALQPLGSFDGYDWIDQFQTAAVRYQLNFSQYALGLMQQERTPAFSGYLSLAQRNLIEKMLDRRIWGFWRWENLWGNFDANPDPIRKDNIMVSGYLGVMVGVYESNTGDARFSEPGALTFRWNDRRAFPYSFGTVSEAVHRNFMATPLGMFPCEPNWVYSACNTFGMNSLLLHDRLHGTTFADDVLPNFARSMTDEFITADGRITAIRSSRLGLTIPSLTSTMADAGSSLFLNASLPDTARRTWEMIRHDFVDMSGDGVEIELRGWDKLDVGNYRRSDVTAHAMVMCAAREHGDDEVYDAVKSAADARFEPQDVDGVGGYAKASTNVNAMFTIARFGRTGAFRDLVTSGPDEATTTGPVLDAAPYPDVLVARAVTDGTGLDLVLRSGNGGGRHPLEIARLQPGATYSVRGAVSNVATADGEGRARIEADVADRVEVAITPRV